MCQENAIQIYTYTHGVLAERLGALSSLTRSGVRPFSSSAAGPLGNICHPVRKRISLSQYSGYSWFYQKKIYTQVVYIKSFILTTACIYIKNILLLLLLSLFNGSILKRTRAIIFQASVVRSSSFSFFNLSVINNDWQ